MALFHGLNRAQVITVASASIIVLIETLLISIAGVWALGGLFSVDRVLVIGAGVASVCLALWLSWRFLCAALEATRDESL